MKTIIRRRISLVTIGWLWAFMAVQSLEQAASAAEPAVAANDVVQAHYHFKITKGHGVAVCDAFLKRLNTADFDAPPYCGIPEETAVAGFKTLHRTSLSLSEVQRLLPHIFWFIQAQQQFIKTPWYYPSDAEYAANALGNNLLAWRYTPPISLNNDGRPDNVLFWSDPGVNYTPQNTYCGQLVAAGRGAVVVRNGTLGFILSKDGQQIDESQTRALFEHPHPDGAMRAFTGPVPPFPTLGSSEGAFSFLGLNYLYVFWGAYGNLEGQERKADYSQNNTLAVLLRRQGKTRQVCEYNMTSDPPSVLRNRP